MSGDSRAFVGRSAFTLIEVLVVVAIIALLLAVLMPSLEHARQTSRAVVCLSHLEQIGTALKSYSAGNKTYLPWAGSFRFSLMEGKYYLGYEQPDPTWIDWERVNIGVLYPRYVGNVTGLFYCPNNLAVDHNGENGSARLRYCYQNSDHRSSGYHTSHDMPFSPLTAYAYAIPAAVGQSPRDELRKTYPEEVVRWSIPYDKSKTKEYPFWTYMNDNTLFDSIFPGPTTKKQRNNHQMNALVSDGYNSGSVSKYEGYHLKGYNVLYSDYHAKRVIDPYGRIHAAGLSAIRPDNMTIKANPNDPNDKQYVLTENAIKVFRVWDYFSSKP